MVGKTLSHYKIVSEIGRGGMGIVYKAEDTKLKRTVALKLLPRATLGNEDDRARFFREAQAAAQLQHANIATVYAIEEASSEGQADQPFIAMEYIEGETLTEHIAQGPLKLKEVVEIATQVALALEAAHEKNIVHRDVKSGNVMLTKKGDAKVLDFGLAKTAQSTKLTQFGSTLGTIAYMSPEQARGEEVDWRSDIWSLGVLLYEMIAGRLPFASEYEQAAVYSILNEEPEPLTSIRSGVPMGLEWIVSKLLAKNANDRYQNISDLLVDLRTVDLQATGMSRISRPSASTAGAATPKSKSSNTGTVRFVIGAAAGATIVILFWVFSSSNAPFVNNSPTLRLTHTIPHSFLPDVIDISDDGSKVAYVVSSLVNVLDLTTGDSYELEGTENTTVVEFSRDGEWLLLTKTVSIERIPVKGGTAVSIINTSEGGPRANWGPDDWIVFEDRQNVFRYSESRSELVQISRIDTTVGEQDVDWPSLLPDGKTVMGTLERGEVGPAQVRFWDFETGDVLKTINFAGYRVQYLPTGHLSGVMGEEGLVVVPFDVDRLEITGPRIPVVAGVIENRVSISRNGTMVYIDETGSAAQLVQSIPAILQFPRFRQRLPIEAGLYTDVELSPDERKLVFLKHEGPGGQRGRSIWVMDLETEVARPITNINILRPNAVAWMSGSDSVAYTRASLPGGPHSIYARAADGSGEERRIMSGRTLKGEIDISSDGNTIAYVAFAGPGNSVLNVFNRRSREDKTIAGLDISSAFYNPQISPDGRFVAYKRSESVFVLSVDGSGVPFNVTFGFGQFPRWSKNGREFFNLTLGGSVQKYPIDSGENFSLSQGWEEQAIIGSSVPYFDVFDDGERAIVADIIDDPATADSAIEARVPLHFVINWFGELE
ncbi:MAG: protein kinase [Bacteroidetes bacterium]|nr:protein kinase [Bacteroidota bacterium]